MDTGSLFAVALNLPHPWRISQVEFKPTEDASMELHIHIAFRRGGKSPARKTIAAKAFLLTTQRRELGVISTSSSIKPISMPISLAYNAKNMA